MGCVRAMVTSVGEVSTLTGEVEQHGLPRSGERVVLCNRSACKVPFGHVADPGGDASGLWGMVPRDGVHAGGEYRTRACDRTCSGCGVTWASRCVGDTHMWVCGGCHAMVPYVKSGVGNTGGAEALLDMLRDECPVYCDTECQDRHWRNGHRLECRRDDRRIHALVVDRFALEFDDDGGDVHVPQYGRVLREGGVVSTIPYLMPCSRSQTGLRDGWGQL